MSAQCLPARWVRRVYRAVELPVRLQRLLCTIGPEAAWRAFTDGAQWWFGLGIERPPTTDRQRMELDAFFFCQDGLLWASGRWSYTSEGGLALCEVYCPTDAGLDRAMESLASRPGVGPRSAARKFG